MQTKKSRREIVYSRAPFLRNLPLKGSREGVDVPERRKIARNTEMREKEMLAKERQRKNESRRAEGARGTKVLCNNT